MISMTLHDIATTLGTSVSGEGDRMVTGVATDSRRVVAGDLFFALDGPHHKGSDFVADALAAGAVATVTQDGAHEAGNKALAVDDTLDALATLGSAVRNKLTIPVIAITGSNGKTTTKDILASMLATRFKVVAAESSFNNGIGVPLTLCRADDSTDVLVIEIGTNNPGEVAALGEISRPTTVVITNVGPSHLSGLEGEEGVLREKLSLATKATEGATLYINGDDKRLRHAQLPLDHRTGKCVSYGVDSDCDVRPLEAEADGGSVSFRLTPKGERIRARLRGRHNLSNLLAAAVVARDLGVDEKGLCQGAAAVTPPRMRMEQRDIGGMRVIFDCYNANPASMNAALDAWASEPVRGRRVAVLGDMLELGDRTHDFHRELGRRLAELGPDCIVLVGEFMRITGEAALGEGVSSDRIHGFSSVVDSREEILGLLDVGDDILLKASRGVGLERLFDKGGADS